MLQAEDGIRDVAVTGVQTCFSSRRRHTRCSRDWSSDVCSSDLDRKQQTGNLVVGQETINAPAGAVFIRGIQVYDSTSATTGANVWLEKKDVTYLQEYVSSDRKSVV